MKQHMGPTMTHKQELELRLNDLLDKKATEERELVPSEVYLSDLAITIGYVQRQLKNAR